MTPGEKIGCLHDGDPHGSLVHGRLRRRIEPGGADNPGTARSRTCGCVALHRVGMGEVDDDIADLGQGFHPIRRSAGGARNLHFFGHQAAHAAA